ncbi:MAG: PAS domain S-box protein [Bacteroidetes bacterium]|nr:PAS domain S-box protein [Bacteroidota bacterium]
MKLFKQLLQASNLLPLGIMWMDEQGRILGANEKLLQELGLGQEEIVQRSILEIDPYTNLLNWRRRWKRLMSDGSLNEKTELISRDGLVFPVRIYYVLMEIEGNPVCCATIENIKLSERFRKLFSLTSKIARLGAWEWDIQKNEFYLSPETKDLLEIDLPGSQFSADQTWKLLSDRLEKDQQPVLKDAMKKVRNSGTSNEMEVVFHFAEGRKQRFMLIAQAVQFDDFTTRVYGSIQDVSSISARSEEMYMAQVTMEHALEMIFWIASDGSVFYVNEAAAEKLEYDRSELIGMKVFEFSPEMNPETWEDHWDELREKKLLEFESYHITKSGEKMPVTLSLNYIKYEDEEYNCAIVRDLSRKKERDLRIRLFEFTINNFPDMALWITEDGSLEMANPAACRALDYQEKELLGMKIWDIIPTLDSSAWKAFWLSMQKTGNRTLQGLKRRKDGELIDTEITASFLRFGGKQFICQFGKDVSGRIKQSKNLELAMKSVAYSNDMIFWVRKDGSFAFTNQAVSSKLGYTEEELKSMTLFDLDKTYTQARLESTWKDLRSGSMIEAEVEIYKKNGKPLPVEATAYYIRYQDEEYRCSIIRDVSEKKKKEAQLKEALDHISKLSEQLEQEKSYLQEEVNVNYNFNNIISKSNKYKPVLQKVRRVADTDATVLILGETGTGKELLARAIHNLSGRSSRAMVKVNCAALPENLIESELFGHEKGAFTGAYQKKVGRFKMADQGSIFLDEIGELPLDLQAKLLRVLQEGQFEPLGGTTTVSVDVRVIAATNRNLEQLVGEGLFREDLFYRLNVFPIRNLPLRERKEDIPLLTQHFLKRFSDKMGRKDMKISEAAMKRLMAYEFPGNIRELENMIERAVILSSGESLNLSSILPDLKRQSIKNRRKHFPTMEELQREHIVNALKRTNWKVTGKQSASELLGMNGKTLASRMRKLGINRQDFMDNL